MSDIDLLADARDWLATQGDRVQTHSGECHRWHPACLVSRLVRELSRAGQTDAKTGDSDPIYPERENAEPAAIARGSDRTDKAVTLTISCTGDICERLRREIAWEPEVGELLAEAADEIERLRLTDEEREAIERDLAWLQWCEDNRQIGDVGLKDIATLRGLLARTSPDRIGKPMKKDE